MHGGKSIITGSSNIYGTGYPHMHGGKSVKREFNHSASECYPHMHGGKSTCCYVARYVTKVIPICMGVNLLLSVLLLIF